ncbi:MAG: metal-dependent transcriptional regulator [Cellulosimicrobium funkei]
MSRSTRWIVVSVVLALVVVLLAPFVYSEVQEGRTPPPLGLQSPGAETASAAPAAPGPFDVDGEWVVAPGSEAGFRADVLDVPADEAVLLGTTPDVTGTLRVADGELQTATVTVATTALRTGSSVADRQLQQALETDLYPTTLFSLTSPLDVSELAATDETVRRLSAQGLLEHAPYGAITLTERGRSLALAMVRRHRLLETYLVSELGYGWDEVHDEAEVLEHAVSDLLIERIDARLGHPTRDPHGDPIPGADGTVVRPPAVPLAELVVGDRGTVVRISDADPDVLRYLAEIGVGLDTGVEVRERREYAGILSVVWSPPAEGVEPVPEGRPAAPAQLGLRAADHVWVVRAEPVSA